ncbi:hypothetical protein RFI_39045 [Reticulomyxa filosa]|uniref:Ion transport domain-containing protein n=1 Tax=Reticulomyxa filosa TaxID=46433 RepID=X6LAA3_RETFI|nr:hypothetical protein RFI_39045 [Reticulomyxa filosa]|eukprot:ETN98453.1 hypothetical protein RFI_39045 [Reticulomyxa filosa]
MFIYLFNVANVKWLYIFIQDEDGVLVAVFVVDYNYQVKKRKILLVMLISFLSSTRILKIKYLNDRFILLLGFELISWIFEEAPNYYLLAASKGPTLESQRSVQGEIDTNIQTTPSGSMLVPVKNYTNEHIKIISKVILEVYKLKRLRNDSTPSQIRMPLDYPRVYAGRELNYESLSWIIVTSVSMSGLTDRSRDSIIATWFIDIVVIVVVVYLLERLKQQADTCSLPFISSFVIVGIAIVGMNIKPKPRLMYTLAVILIFAALVMIGFLFCKKEKKRQSEDSEQKQSEDSEQKQSKSEMIIESILGLCCKKKKKSQSEDSKQKQSESEKLTNVLDKLIKGLEDKEDLLLYMAIRALNEKDKLHTSSMYEVCSSWTLNKYRYLVGTVWQYFIKIVEVVFLIISAWDAKQCEWVKLILLFFMIIDIILKFLPKEKKDKIRQYRCQKNHNQNNNDGSQGKINGECLIQRIDMRDILYVLLVIFFTIACILRLASGIALTSYVPLEGMLVVISIDHLYELSRNYIRAIFDAREIFFVWMCMILLAASFGGVYFRNSNTNELTNNFNGFPQALLTTFVLMPTGENYTDVAYSRGWASFVFCLVLIITGLILNPILAGRFQKSFKESRVADELAKKKRKDDALHCAYYFAEKANRVKELMNMCEYLADKPQKQQNTMNEDQEQNFKDMFKELIIPWNITFSQARKIFLERKCDKCTSCTSDKYISCTQKCLERNIFQQKWRRHVIIIVGIAPALIASCLLQLDGPDITATKGVLITCFIFNAIEIFLRWFAFGFCRFFDVIGFKDHEGVNHKEVKNTKVNHKEINLQSKSSEVNHTEVNNNDEEQSNVVYWSRMDRKIWNVVNLVEFLLFSGAIVAIIYSCFMGYETLQLTMLVMSLTRIFTILPSSQRIIMPLYSALTKYCSLFALIVIFMFSFMRLGVALFAGKSNLMEVIDGNDPNINFDTNLNAIRTLTQMSFQNGWSDIMYDSVLSTNYYLTFFFVFFMIGMVWFATGLLFAQILDTFDNETDEIKYIEEQQNQQSQNTDNDNVLLILGTRIKLIFFLLNAVFTIQFQKKFVTYNFFSQVFKSYKKLVYQSNKINTSQVAVNDNTNNEMEAYLKMKQYFIEHYKANADAYTSFASIIQTLLNSSFSFFFSFSNKKIANVVHKYFCDFFWLVNPKDSYSERMLEKTFAQRSVVQRTT